MRITEDTTTEIFEISGVSKREMFYILEKAFESVQRAIKREEPPKEHPLYKLLKWYADNSTIDFGGLTESICNLVTDLS